MEGIGPIQQRSTLPHVRLSDGLAWLQGGVSARRTTMYRVPANQREEWNGKTIDHTAKSTNLLYVAGYVPSRNNKWAIGVLYRPGGLKKDCVSPSFTGFFAPAKTPFFKISRYNIDWENGGNSLLCSCVWACAKPLKTFAVGTWICQADARHVISVRPEITTPQIPRALAITRILVASWCQRNIFIKVHVFRIGLILILVSSRPENVP